MPVELQSACCAADGRDHSTCCEPDEPQSASSWTNGESSIESVDGMERRLSKSASLLRRFCTVSHVQEQSVLEPRSNAVRRHGSGIRRRNRRYCRPASCSDRRNAVVVTLTRNRPCRQSEMLNLFGALEIEAERILGKCAKCGKQGDLLLFADELLEELPKNDSTDAASANAAMNV